MENGNAMTAPSLAACTRDNMTCADAHGELAQCAWLWRQATETNRHHTRKPMPTAMAIDIKKFQAPSQASFQRCRFIARDIAMIGPLQLSGLTVAAGHNIHVPHSTATRACTSCDWQQESGGSGERWGAHERRHEHACNNRRRAVGPEPHRSKHSCIHPHTLVAEPQHVVTCTAACCRASRRAHE